MHSWFRGMWRPLCLAWFWHELSTTRSREPRNIKRHQADRPSNRTALQRMVSQKGPRWTLGPNFPSQGLIRVMPIMVIVFFEMYDVLMSASDCPGKLRPKFKFVLTVLKPKASRPLWNGFLGPEFKSIATTGTLFRHFFGPDFLGFLPGINQFCELGMAGRQQKMVWIVLVPHKRNIQSSCC